MSRIHPIKRICSVALAAFLCLPLAACQETQPPDASSAISEDRVSSTFISSEASSVTVENGGYPPNQPPAPEVTAPDFLDAEQQLLFRRAYDLYGCFTMSSSNFDSNYPDPESSTIDSPENIPQIEKDGYPYTQAYGRYKTWADFECLALSLFTRDYFNELNSGPPQYVEQDGLLYHLNGDRGGNISRTNDPDTFALVSKTDKRIEFTVTGYYWNWEEYSGEEQNNLGTKSGWDTTESYPIIMEKTPDGWRFSQFNFTF